MSDEEQEVQQEDNFTMNQGNEGIEDLQETVSAPLETSTPKPAEEEAVMRSGEHRKSKYTLKEDEDPNSCEAKVRMELEMKKRKEKEKDEFAEYEAMRQAEREREALELESLRERREQRKRERAEEEKHLNELRAVEDQKRRSEEEERQKRKREEERLKKEKHERSLMEREQRNRFVGRPNFVINKRGDGGVSIGEEETPIKVQKTREQLEAEKRAVLEQRCQPLNINGFNVERLKEKARELHQLICRLEGDKYDLMHRFERQNYEMMEMSEKARQMNKGAKNSKVNVPQTPDPLLTKMSGIPHKVQMYSQYERVKDHRSFNDRRELFTGPLYGEEYERIMPLTKIVMTEQGARVIQDYNGDDPASISQAAEV